MIDKRRKLLLVLLIIVLVFAYEVECQETFKKRYGFSLGQNVIKAKFSPDYTLLAVLRSDQNALFSYNPVTFEPIGESRF